MLHYSALDTSFSIHVPEATSHLHALVVFEVDKQASLFNPSVVHASEPDVV